ncbi:MAG: response regulator, partial [Patescibacteria group bacterium]|nr:response regulator [Patescibacteria group bacterium]
QIFRIHGDDFVLLSKEHLDIDMKTFNDLDILCQHNITVTKRHINLREDDSINLKGLEELD